MIGQPVAQTPQEQFRAQLDWTVTRLRTISLDKLNRDERIDSTREVIQSLADVGRITNGLEAIAVPHLNASALADQLQVIGNDLITCANEKVLESAASQLQHLRLNL